MQIWYHNQQCTFLAISLSSMQSAKVCLFCDCRSHVVPWQHQCSGLVASEMEDSSLITSAVGLDKRILPKHFQVWQRHHPVLFTAFEFGGWIRFRELSSIFGSLIDFGWTLPFQVNASVQNLKIPFQLRTNQPSIPVGHWLPWCS